MLLNSLSPAAAGRALLRVLFPIFLLAVVTAGMVQAQAQALSPEEEPPKIRKIEIKFLGLTSVPNEVVRANMSLREGMPYDLTLVDRDIRSLFRTGLFKTIDVKETVVSRTQMDLTFELRAKSRIGAVRFEGNEKMSTKKLQSEVTVLLNPVADEQVIKSDKDKLEKMYRKAGYSQVRVEYHINEDPVTGLATVVFNIEEGPKVKITKVDFVGNEMIKDKVLRGEMETSKWQWWSFMTGSGKYDDKKFDEDLDKVVDLYKEKGFLDVVVDPAKITFSYPKPDEMTISIQVQEGKQYRIGDVTVSGNKLFPSEVLVRVARVRTGDVFAPKKLDEEVENMEHFFGQFGYLDTRAQLIRRPNVTTGAIDIEFVIRESGRYIVQSVNIEGNTKTKSIVVLREILLAPGDVFDSVRMETSRLRLENTRFFEDVDVRAVPTTIPNRKDLKISFTEGRTGNLTFGAGYSSLEGAVFYIELTQANFDLFNRRSFFQGDGQKFRLKTQVGSSSSELVLGFEEPFLFERELNFGFTIFRERSDYTSSYYDEIHQGFEIYLRKRLIELVTGRLAYGLQNVEIFNIDPSVADIFGGSNKTKISKVSLTLERDTRNSLLTPSRGSNLQGIFEVGGGALGGDVDYYKMEGRLAQYFTLFDVQNQVLEIIARTGVAQEYGDTLTIPIYDRFYLGGQNTLRGFEYRDVGPKTIFGEPTGGKTYGYLSLEYSADIVAPMRFAFFYDAGFVNKGSFDFNPSGFNDNFGFGVRFFLLGQPMRIDYGIPLTTDRTNDKGGQFNFSFGTRF
jgi:outer membrane protein insertion porin family